MDPTRRLLIAVAVSIAVAACAGGTNPGWTTVPSSPPPVGAAATPAPAVAGGTLGTIEVRAFDLGFDPATVTVATAGRYQLQLHNDGSIPHDIHLPSGAHIHADPGEMASGVVDVPAGGTPFVCSITGHAQAGMVGEIVVAGAAPADPGDDHGGPAPGTEVDADPAAPEYVLRDATAPAPLEGTVHDIELVMTEREMTIAEGFVQRVWTFGDTVPGPVIRVRQGDTVRIHLRNPETNQLPHSIDFHASRVAWNDEMTSISPGEGKLYEFKAEFAGVWMYHCGTPPTLHHIANGMYGMLIVEPREGLRPVDREVAIVQSEWYLGPQKSPSDLAKAAAAAPAPDFVLFNGVADQYADHPIEVGTGERVRAFILNVGPSVDSSFHIVGTIFDRVIREGAPELQDGWGSQAVDLAPAQGAIVEFTLVEDGLYPMVTHAFNFVGRGALGLFQAGDGDPLD